MTNIQKKLSDIIQTLQEVPEIQRIYLFGSRARGDAQSRSDIDIAIETKEPITLRKQRHIKEIAEERSGLYTLDIVFLESCNEKLHTVIKEQGIKLYEKE